MVQGTPQRRFDALLDFESCPDWQQAVNDCEVQSRDGEGRGQRVYGLRMDPGAWLPGKLAPILEDQVKQRSVEDLKARVETAA